MSTIPMLDLGRHCREHQHWILGPEVGEIDQVIAAVRGLFAGAVGGGR